MPPRNESGAAEPHRPGLTAPLTLARFPSRRLRLQKRGERGSPRQQQVAFPNAAIEQLRHQETSSSYRRTSRSGWRCSCCRPWRRRPAIDLLRNGLLPLERQPPSSAVLNETLRCRDGRDLDRRSASTRNTNFIACTRFHHAMLSKCFAAPAGLAAEIRRIATYCNETHLMPDLLVGYLDELLGDQHGSLLNLR